MSFKSRFGFHKFVPRVVRADEMTEARSLLDTAAHSAAPRETRLTDELDLPDDLALLAEQLGADADFLAARYPADATDRVIRPTAVHFAADHVATGRVRWAWLSVAALLFVAAGIWSGSGMFEHQQPSAVVSTDGSRTPQTKSTADVALPSELPVTPSMYFQDLSGPEQEGLLDLFEEESLPQSSLSI